MKTSLLFFFYLSISFLNAQNLVPNPSFEEYYTCPLSAGGLGVNGGDPWIKYWYSMSLTPDYMHYCVGDPNASNYPTNNAWGYQEPYEGDGYISLISINGVGDEREYIAIELIEPLIVGITYDISFYASDADGGEIEYIDCVSNNIGIKLLVNPPYYWFNEQNNLPLIPNNSAHVFMEDILTDSIGWTLIDGSIIVDQPYTHLVIGNFFTDENTLFVQTNDAGCESMQFIDQVCIVKQGNDCNALYSSLNSVGIIENNIPTIIEANLVLSEFDYPQIKEIQIYDITGSLCFCETNITQELNVSFLKSGIYFLLIEMQNGLFIKNKILKE